MSDNTNTNDGLITTTIEKRQAPAGAYAQRIIRACDCKYQQEKDWWYEISKYVGGTEWWKTVGVGPLDAVRTELANRTYPALCRCLGCGREILRDYPPADDDHHAMMNGPRIKQALLGANTPEGSCQPQSRQTMTEHTNIDHINRSK